MLRRRNGSLKDRHLGSTNGFSLIELLIVVAIILIIAAIAIPNLLQARLAANESSAAGSLHSLTSAEVTYYNAYPNVGYASAIAQLGGASPCTPSSVTACLIDNFLATAIPGGVGKSGYYYLATGVISGGQPTTTRTLSRPRRSPCTTQETGISAPPTTAFCDLRWAAPAIRPSRPPHPVTLSR